MKKALTVLLLPVFLFSIIGWQWIFFLKLRTHQLIERSMNQDDDGLELIVVNANSSRGTFFVNDHEVFHHGKLYDVKLKKRRGDDLLCYCERDGEEESLLSTFDCQTKDSFDHTSAGVSKTQKITKLSVFERVNHGALIASPYHDLIYKNYPFLPLLFQTENSFFVPPDVA